MIIDSHQHFWKYDPLRYDWIDDSMTIINRDFLPQDLQPILQANKVSGCVAVQAHQSEEETHFLLKHAQENSFIKGVVGWVDLTSNNVGERLAILCEQQLLKGVRHIVQAEKDDFVLRDDFQKGISQLSDYGLTYDLLVFPRQLPAAIELVQMFPEQEFILDHIAKPRVSEKLNLKWSDNISALASCQNVSCKVSGMVTEANNNIWKPADFAPYLDTVFEAFGIDRLMFGSDWPVCLLAADYAEVLSIVIDYLEKFSKEEKAKVLGENAIRIYKL